MKNISFDNPYLLLLIIPLALLILAPYFLIRNKDNRSIGWNLSLVLHILVAAAVTLAAAGLSSTRVLTKTTVYVLADVSYSSERSRDEIDGYIKEIEESLPDNSSVGVVCFGRDYEILTIPGREIKSVSEARVNDGATDIAGALSFTAGLFEGDSLKRIILITDGNDTVSESAASIAQTVENITENGIRVDSIFLDTSLKEGEKEVQLLSAEHSETAYISHASEVRFLLQASERFDTVLSLYVRPLDSDGNPIGEFRLVTDTVVSADEGLLTVRMSLPTAYEGDYEYKATLTSDEDISEHNNERTFRQRVVGKKKILLVTGSSADEALLLDSCGADCEIDSYVVHSSGTSVPVNIEEIIEYDEIILSNLDVRKIRNANAFIDTVSTAVSQYGKSLLTLGNLELHTNSEDKTFARLEELLPLDFGATGVDGRLYTIVLDASHSMFMASKFTIAKDTAIKLLSIIEDNDYVCLVTFSGTVNIKPAKRAGECREELITYIEGLTTSHGTDIALGLEEALNAVKTVNRAHNQVMVVSDGFSFDSERTAAEVAADLAAEGATVSCVNAYIPYYGTDGSKILQGVASAGGNGNYYEISSPERVSDVVFGSMAEDFADVVIEKDSRVTLAIPKDAVLNGITSIPAVSGYVLSVSKYDATVPLKVTYLKDNGYQETVPLYAYRSHGNGRVASFATSLSGAWSAGLGELRGALLANAVMGNTPTERINRPFTVTVEEGLHDAYIELTPAVLDPAAAAVMRITYPSGRTVSRTLAFDGAKHFFTLSTPDEGAYKLSITYSYGDKSYTYSRLVEVAYLPEYDAFTSVDRYNVYQFMRDNGETAEGAIPDMENDSADVATYKQSYIIPLLIIAVSLFICDVAVRKLRKNRKKSGAAA